MHTPRDPQSSDAITARNRANARHSTGPRTTAGKAASSRNALTHGLLSTHSLAVGDEDQAAMDDHRVAYCADLQARGAVQVDLAERAAYIVWRLARLARHKAHLVRSPRPVPGRGDYAAMSDRFVFAERPALEFDPATHRQRQIALGDAAYTLEQLNTWANLPAAALLPTRAAEALLAAYAGAMGPLDAVLGALPDFPAGQSLAGYCAAHLQTVDAWRNRIRGLAEELHITWVGLGDLAIHNAREEVSRLAESLMPVPPPLPLPPPAPPAAVLPDLVTLECLIRYEAHLSRELSRILRELRQLQSAGVQPPDDAAPPAGPGQATASTPDGPAPPTSPEPTPAGTPARTAGQCAPATSPHGRQVRASQAWTNSFCETNRVSPARETSLCETNPALPAREPSFCETNPIAAPVHASGRIAPATSWDALLARGRQPRTPCDYQTNPAPPTAQAAAGSPRATAVAPSASIRPQSEKDPPDAL